MSGLDIHQLNGLALAYIGDAVYELHVRKHMLREGDIRPNRLHEQTTSYVSASAQAELLHRWLKAGMLTEVEEAIVRRGRNAKSGSLPKNADVATYRYSTGFEALIGFLHLNRENDRLSELLVDAFQGGEAHDFLIESEGDDDEK